MTRKQRSRIGKSIEEGDVLERRLIDLPKKEWSLLSHIKNIDYGIKQLKDNPNNQIVIGYRLVRFLGVREQNHELLPQKLAKMLCESDRKYRYVSLSELLTRKEEIQKGKYEVRNGLIISLNSQYDKA